MGDPAAMSSQTEARIRELCAQITSAESVDVANRAATELRRALDEHILLAKDSLQDQADILALLEQVAKRAAAPTDVCLPHVRRAANRES